MVHLLTGSNLHLVYARDLRDIMGPACCNNYDIRFYLINGLRGYCCAGMNLNAGLSDLSVKVFDKPGYVLSLHALDHGCKPHGPAELGLFVKEHYLVSAQCQHPAASSTGRTAADDHYLLLDRGRFDLIFRFMTEGSRLRGR